MHVLFVFNHPAPYKVKLFNELSKAIQVSAIFERLKNKDRNPLFYESRELLFKNVRIKGINLGLENHFSRGIVDYIKNNKFDIIVMNGWHTFSEMMAINYLKKHHIPYLFYINGGIIKSHEPKVMKKIKTYFISGADLYFSPDENSNNYLTYYGADASKIVNYPYSTIYDSEVLKQTTSIKEKTELRKALNIKGEKVFVSCGQFIPRKNHTRLIKYWSKQPENNRLLIIGGGKEKNKYLKLISSLGIKNVKILDFMTRNNLFMYFKAADAYIFPSKEDIYGHVINEALSQGLPVISNKGVNSALRLIKNGENGYIVDINQDEEIDNAIANVLNKPEMQNKALDTSQENTLEIMAKVHLEAFHNWVNKK
ncbi:MAG: glycosyltransferase [Bacilli bacterium]|nr:glycosyltransferase [Bacilli bacterium]